MTIEELANWPADKLKALTKEQLYELCKEWFPKTRPEMIERKPTANSQAQMILSPEKRKALAMLADEGVDISFVNRKKR